MRIPTPNGKPPRRFTERGRELALFVGGFGALINAAGITFCGYGLNSPTTIVIGIAAFLVAMLLFLDALHRRKA